MICSVWMKKVKELKKFPQLYLSMRITFRERERERERESERERVNEETQVSIFNRLGTKGSCSTAPDKYVCTVCNKVYK